MRICSQLLLLFEIQHVFQFNSPCLPVKSSEIPIVSSEIHHFPKIFLNSLTMFPSDVPLIFLRKKITFFHVFPSFKKKHQSPGILPGICQENPTEIQVKFPPIQAKVCLCADALDVVAARCCEFQRCHQLLREDGAVAAGGRGHCRMGPPQRWSRSVA
jgi:hypothetical protein